MTKLHKLIRISHDGTTFFIRPATVRSTVRLLTARLRPQSGGSAGQDRNDRIGASPRTVRTAEPVPPPLEEREKRHAAPDTKGAEHLNRQRPIPFRPANAAWPVRTESKRTRPKYLRFFNKKALRARSGIRRFRIISYLRSRNRGRPCRPQRRPLRQATLIRTSETNDRYTF